MQSKIPSNYWEKLVSYEGVRNHTIDVIICAMRGEAFDGLTKDEKNILKWAALFHDISKRGIPEICGRDHIHPFVSGATTLETLKHMGILKINKEEEETFTSLIKLIADSFKKLEGAELVAQLKRTRW